MKKDFTKDDLKCGMLVRLRNNDLKLVSDHGQLISINPSPSNNLNNYTYTLYSTLDKNFDIVCVYSSFATIRAIIYAQNELHTLCLWERKELKEVTMSEVEEKFGCKVKIINDK